MVKKNQCQGIIKYKKSKFYNLQCGNSAKNGSYYCGVHKKIKKNLKSKCLGLKKNNLKCNRLVETSYCFQHKKKTIATNEFLLKKDIKKELGQFYSVNCAYIFKGMVIPKVINSIIEPFSGSGELLK